MNMGKANKCNLKENKPLAKVINTNICMMKVFSDTKKETGVEIIGKLSMKRLVLKKVVIVNF